VAIELRAPADLIGYETAWFAVEPRAGGGGRLVPQFAEFHREGEVTRQDRPRANFLVFGSRMAYFRMLFMARRTESSDHDIFVLAAASQAELETRTRALEAGTEECEAATLQSTCIIAPRQVAIVAFLRVSVRGEEVLVHPGATLYHALEEGGVSEPAKLLPTLAVRKAYQRRLVPVEFPRASIDILALPLAGGEEIRW
jgi:hypothetical protein